MSCYHPYMRWEDIHGKVEFTTVETKFPEIKRNGKLEPPIIIEQTELHGFHKTNKAHWKRVDLIPCGQCLGCRMDYSKNWATRIACECQATPEDNWFITLTFSPENLWKTEHATINLITGELAEGHTVKKEHIQKFMKDLRRHWEYHFGEKGIRFYGVGEYGEQHGRPHYHICTFNLKIKPEMLEKWFINKSGDQIYKCPIIEKIWGNGIVGIGKVTWESAAYVARYMLKKQKGMNAKAYYAMQGILPEFSLMSRMPGIGREYYEMYKQKIFEFDQIQLPGKKLGKSVKPPKYFDRLYDLEEPEVMAAIKEKRSAAMAAADQTRKKANSQNLGEYLECKERKKEKQIKSLIRNYENS